MNRRIYLYFILTIVLGAILGGVGTYYFLWYNGHLQRPHGFNKDHAMEHLKKVLDLSDTQMQQLSQIFDDSAQKTRDLQKQLDPQFQAIHQETREHIRQILNPDQTRKFDEYVRQIDERRKRRDSPPPPQ